ncbi:MAG: M1 family metallopeptidase [Bacteroidetes bacterium]|nr:M1 family metallopeptidase [Bacteroidota bacterium]
MQRLTSLIIFGCLTLIKISTLNAQYWQQRVDYNISVTLNDQEHKLIGNETIVYHNLSPNTLNEIYIHFWMNAYSDKRSPLFKQLAEDGELEARFVNKDGMGYVRDLNFKVNGETAELSFEDEFKEIGKLTLNAPLQPEDSVQINAEFLVKMPGDLSRGGHVDNHYNVTQWFPKVALYDKDGWHTMPYLNWGEYYDEFGRYDVSITVPKKYVVGATGNLKAESEIDWLNQQVELSNKAINTKNYDFINERKKLEGTKTIRFVEENIHDFAWFASPDFLVLKEAFTVEESDHEMEAWSFFPPSKAETWGKSVDYLKSSTNHYSTKVGLYPYKTVKAVYGALRAGGGMEYPTITVIGPGTESVLHTVILHEVGHNWFQGMLGTNERRFPYMDEAINSFYENMFFDGKAAEDGFDFYNEVENRLSDLVIKHTSLRHESQANNLHSCHYSKGNYGMVVYSKAANAFNYLEDYLGEERFADAMHSFFQLWKFKHPQPEDLKAVFEDYTHENLDWFFNDMMTSEGYLDYDIFGVDLENSKVLVNNRGQIAAPFKITVKSKGKVVQEFWQPGIKQKLAVDIRTTDFDEIHINEGVFPYETNLRNNSYKKGKSSEKAKLKAFMPVNNNQEISLAYAPFLGFNTSDGLMLGLGLYNGAIPQPKFAYQLAPMYGLRSGNLAGTGNIEFNHFAKGKFHNHLKVGIRGSQFSKTQSSVIDGDYSVEQLSNVKVEPYLSWKFRPTPIRISKSHELGLSYIYRSMPITAQNLAQTHVFSTARAQYTFEDTYPLFTKEWNTRFEVGTEFTRITSEFKAKLPYTAKRDIRFRVFAGKFLSLENTDGFSSLAEFTTAGSYGASDVLMDGYLIDRSQNGGLWSNQQLGNFGGFATTTRTFKSSDYLLALNVNGPLPFLTPNWCRLFVNAAVLPNPLSNENESVLISETGLMISAGKGVLEIYIPLAYSQLLRDNLELNGRLPFAPTDPFNFTQNITFKLDFHQLNPFKLMEDIGTLVGG